MIPWITFLAALGVIFVLAQQLRHTSDREAKNYRELVEMLMKDRDGAREEAHALRVAIFPALARIAQPKAAPVEVKKEAEIEKPLSLNERIRTIWLNRKLSTRQKMAEITRISNSRQSRIDTINEMAENAEKAQQVQSEKPNEEKPA
jgi:hypothetical protein